MYNNFESKINTSSGIVDFNYWFEAEQGPAFIDCPTKYRISSLLYV